MILYCLRKDQTPLDDESEFSDKIRRILMDAWKIIEEAEKIDLENGRSVNRPKTHWEVYPTGEPTHCHMPTSRLDRDWATSSASNFYFRAKEYARMVDVMKPRPKKIENKTA